MIATIKSKVYIKVTGWLCVCLSVFTAGPIWFSFTVKLICPGKVYNYFAGAPTLLSEIGSTLRKKITMLFLNLKKLKLILDELFTIPFPRVPIDAFRGE